MAATFTNFEAYAETIRDADVDVRLLHPYQRCWSIDQRELGTLRVQYGVEGSGLLTRGAVRADGWAFYMQRSGDPVPINGKLLSKHSIAILPPQAEFCFSGRGRVEWYSVYLPSVALALNADVPSKFRSAGVLAVEKQLYSRIRSALDVMFASEPNEHCATSSESVVMQANISSAFCELFSESGESSCSTERQVDVDRRALISQVSELIHDAGGWEFPVPKLCNAVGVSQRTLLTAFREQLGTTPQNYLIAHRLYLARRLLVKATHETTVASVAAKVGFFDLGRFAGRYLMMFGEHPSDTLRQRIGYRRSGQPLEAEEKQRAYECVSRK